MNILILGDIVGPSGREKVFKELKKIIKNKKIDFVIANGENIADDGVGITNLIADELLNIGVDVITSGNHIWDHKETMNYISDEKRLLRPENMFEGTPGNGFGIFVAKNKKKVAVLNLMGNVFMKKCDDVFQTTKKILDKIKLKNEVDFFIIDIHGEITSEKMALGHYCDGKVTAVVGTHTHVPTSDFRILKKGTAYQTDLGMCGDYDSVIGMNTANSLNKFFKNPLAKKHFPSLGESTISGLIVNASNETGLSISVSPLIIGKNLKEMN